MSLTEEIQKYPIHISRMTTLPPEYVRKKFQSFLKEDHSEEDITTLSTVPESVSVKAEIVAEEECVVAGTSFLRYCFPENVSLEVKINDGNIANNNDVLAIGIGPARAFLSRERVILNLMQRLCGIATLTRKYSEIANKYDCKILDTRKMTPGLRLFEKYAVAVGGGYNHRLDLKSAVLVKDNHLLASGGVKAALRNLENSEPSVPVELEVDALDQLEEGLMHKVDGFLLDNMNPDQIMEAIDIVRDKSNGRRVFLEASGGITLEKLKVFASTGIEAISVGALTTGVKNTNLKMEFKTLQD